MQDDLLISRRELLAVLFRRRNGILAIFLTCIAGALFGVYYLISPTYQSAATLIINTSFLTEPLRDSPPESDFEKLAYFHTQRDILASERLAAEAVRRTRLAERRVIGRIERIEMFVGDVKRSIGGLLDIEKWKRPYSPEAAAIGAVHDGIRTFALPDSKAIKVTLRAKDPNEAAEVLEALLAAHNDYYFEQVRKKAAGAVSFLEKEYDRTREALVGAETALYRLKRGERGFSIDEKKGTVRGRGNATILGITDSAKVQEELKIYVLKLEEALRVANEITDNEQRERVTSDIKARMQRYVDTLNVMPQQELELVRLKRQFDIHQDQFQLIQRNLARARLVATGETDQIRLIEVFQAPLVSEDIVFPQKKLVLGLGAVLGLVLALTWAFVADYLDHTFRTGRDVERHLNSRLIASLPRIASR
jgi:uncharacterized protein involved in exopolysaccharide biosynthesis